MTDPKKSGWGKGIVVLYVAFAVFILTIVAIASFQRFDLVEDHYYDRELAYQKQIDKTSRANALAKKPGFHFDYENRLLTVTFPAGMPPEKISGSLILYRPSGASLDKSVTLKLDGTGRQSVSTVGMPAGFWKAKLDWQVGADEYYLEESFFIN